jgi:hypothetical protein
MSAVALKREYPRREQQESADTGGSQDAEVTQVSHVQGPEETAGRVSEIPDPEQTFRGVEPTPGPRISTMERRLTQDEKDYHSKKVEEEAERMFEGSDGNAMIINRSKAGTESIRALRKDREAQNKEDATASEQKAKERDLSIQKVLAGLQSGDAFQLMETALDMQDHLIDLPDESVGVLARAIANSRDQLPANLGPQFAALEETVSQRYKSIQGIEQVRQEKAAAEQARKAAQAESQRKRQEQRALEPPEPTGIGNARDFGGPDATQALSLDETGAPIKPSVVDRAKKLFGGLFGGGQ